MRVLALDTTTREGSAALVVDDRVVDERRGDASRSHAERLPGELLAIVDAHGLVLSDLDLFAVASGPGSFTGLRIGIATVQGLAFTTRRTIVTVSALEALANIGSGAASYRDLIEGAMGAGARVADPPAPALAGMIARLARATYLAGHRPGPHAIRPIYVRRPDAVLARLARQESTGAHAD